MGTRCLTVLEDENKNEIAVIYRQFDGYPDGHGAELAEFLSGFKMVNGISGDEPEKFANGTGCLAAQIVAHFKKKEGGIYLHAAGTRDVWEDYTYYVTGTKGSEPTIKVDCGEGFIFEGPASDFSEFLNKLEDAHT
jgi:hypothetical protein